jgi:carbonic anhydrase/acetyltransferase-like protein (isoleucine patch superfamily)
MIYAAGGKRPTIDETAYVAPTAVVGGQVTVGPGCALLHGCVIVSEGAPIELGESCVVMEHAVVRASAKAVSIGDRTVISPHAYVVDVSLPQDSHVPIGSTLGENAKARNAETYAAFLRKSHLDDAVVESKRPPKKAPAIPEEIPSAPHVEGVDNAMMLELAEMEHRRQESLRKQRPR